MPQAYQRVRIGNRIINLDNIVSAVEHKEVKGVSPYSVCICTLGSETIFLEGYDAQLFWIYYSSTLTSCLDLYVLDADN